MKELSRLLATLIIWGAVVAIVANVSLFAANSLVLVMFFTALAAGLGTAAVWGGAEALSVIWGQGRAAQQQPEESVKVKRSSRERIVRLIEQMDDDELRQLGEAMDDIDVRSSRR